MQGIVNLPARRPLQSAALRRVRESSSGAQRAAGAVTILPPQRSAPATESRRPTQWRVRRDGMEGPYADALKICRETYVTQLDKLA